MAGGWSSQASSLRESRRSAPYHAGMPIVRGIKRFVDVPSTWEGWVMRVMTVSVIIMIAVSIVLLQLVLEQRSFSNVSRQQRQTFQSEETARQCELLRFDGASPDRLRDLKC